MCCPPIRAVGRSVGRVRVSGGAPRFFHARSLAHVRPFVEENAYIRSFDATYRDLLCSAEADSKVASRIIVSELFELKEEKKLTRSMIQQN